ncbi:WS/DGAT/MGAT family O-acyltransferase [Mycolicibacterium tusciae]|uniref:Diacylglycerol O-acyltransferase n=1 Tax=Mycolicibacterium tusciae TaxID=75922 RepID=A0A1X0JYY7_9MYCO|nr:wax ester/triacylglycerol synthase family O-acyltransferase [Mycolicibacterium tusciae]ORB67815.1 diacylglycerol O-acyltransferase [Mycolicibacterium tusciae]
MRTWQQLSGLDASMLYLETATQPLQVFSVLELDPASIPGGYAYERFRDALAARVRAIPALREKPSERFGNVDHPVWVEDADFDIDRHVHRITLGAPGGWAQLSELAGRLAGLPLDRRRPLWELWIIEGVVGGRLAVLFKVHHSAADGVTYAKLLSQLCSAEPDSPPPEPVAAAAAPTRLQLAVGGLTRFASRPLHLVVTVLPAAIRAAVDSIRRAARGSAMAAPFTAPRTRLNGRLTAQRNVAFARLDLDDVKRVKNHFGVSVNDVAMTLASGVIRQFLLDRGELPEPSLVALVPVSVHEPALGQGRNQVSGMFARLQTQIADPVARLRALAAVTAHAKEHASAIDATLLQDFCQLLGPIVLGIAKRVYARLTQFRPMYNLVVSNVPGPQTDYFLGAEVLAVYPFGPVMHGSGLNITMWSVNGKLHVSLISCPALLPDLSELADGFAIGLKELLAEVG